MSQEPELPVPHLDEVVLEGHLVEYAVRTGLSVPVTLIPCC